jgi:hypothetical protein
MKFSILKRNSIESFWEKARCRRNYAVLVATRTSCRPEQGSCWRLTGPNSRWDTHGLRAGPWDSAGCALMMEQHLDELGLEVARRALHTNVRRKRPRPSGHYSTSAWRQLNSSNSTTNQADDQTDDAAHVPSFPQCLAS